MKITLSQAIPLVIGIILIAILLVLTFFFSLQPLVTIIGVIIGAVISITSQFWAQRLAWKRDYSLKAIEQIYSPLYGVILPIEKILEEKEYVNTAFGHWDGCKKDYRYFMVDTKFREKLDDFYDKMELRSKKISRLETIIIPKIQVEIAGKIFPFKPNPERQISMYIMYFKSHKQIQSFYMRLIRDIKQQLDLDTIAKNALVGLNLKDEDIDNVECKIVFSKEENVFIPNRAEIEKNDPKCFQYESTNQRLNIDFFNACLKETAQTPEHQSLIQEEPSLFESVKEIKKELIQRIEEPWNTR